MGLHYDLLLIHIMHLTELSMSPVIYFKLKRISSSSMKCTYFSKTVNVQPHFQKEVSCYQKKNDKLPLLRKECHQLALDVHSDFKLDHSIDKSTSESTKPPIDQSIIGTHIRIFDQGSLTKITM